MKKNGEDSYQHVLKYTGLFGGVQGLIILIGLVRNKAMALLLGAGGMGFNALMTGKPLAIGLLCTGYPFVESDCSGIGFTVLRSG